MAVETILNSGDMRALRATWRKTSQNVAFVPTMGALHDGHLSLVQQAKRIADRVVISIFVNPLQFGPNEDFARYPRTLTADLEKLNNSGADVVFAPNAAEIYPAGFQTIVSNKEMSQGLCGRFRPGHFDGVLTVVLKLFNIVTPTVAIFGKKDYQQWKLIQRMAGDLALATEVMGVDTIREQDGLAMSSRNRYLSAEQRAQANLIYQGMFAAQASWQQGERQKAKMIEAFAQKVDLCPGMKIQYAELVRQTDLSDPGPVVGEDPLVLIVAVLWGDVRLIDNLEFQGASK